MVEEVYSHQEYHASGRIGRFTSWKKVILHPKEVFETEKQYATLGEGMINVFVYGLLLSLVFSFVFFVMGIGLLSKIPLIGSYGAVFAGLGSLSLFLFLPGLVLEGWLIGSFYLHIFAYLFGGRGKFSTFAYFTSIYTPGIGLLSFLIILLLQIVRLSIVGVLIAVLLSLIYAVSALKSTHGFGTGKAVATIIIAGLVLVGITYAMLSLLFGSLLRLIGGGLITF